MRAERHADAFVKEVTAAAKTDYDAEIVEYNTGVCLKNLLNGGREIIYRAGMGDDQIKTVEDAEKAFEVEFTSYKNCNDVHIRKSGDAEVKQMDKTALHKTMSRLLKQHVQKVIKS